MKVDNKLPKCVYLIDMLKYCVNILKECNVPYNYVENYSNVLMNAEKMLLNCELNCNEKTNNIL